MKNTLSILIILALAGCSNKPGTTNPGGVPGNPVVTWNADPDSSRIDLGFPVLDVETTTLLEPDGKTDGIGTYSHHSHITIWKGRLIATWSNAPKDEDSPGQKGLGRLARELRRDGSLGPIFWLYDDPVITSEEGEPFYTLIREGIYNDIAQKINEYLEKPDVYPSWDFLYYKTRPEADDGHVMCEPTYAWQLADGTWMRLYRDLSRSGYNYSSFSKDGGKNWSVPLRTNFPDAPSRSNAGSLPDGTVYVISNIRNNGKIGGPLYPRDPLAISLSPDGLNFNRVLIVRCAAEPARFEGRHKDTGFEYPSSVVDGKYLYVMYSVNKEDIQVSKIKISKKSGPIF